MTQTQEETKIGFDFPNSEPILIVRPCLLALCLKVRPAAKLLSAFLYHARYTPVYEKSFTIYRSQGQLVEDMCGEITEKTLHDIAVPSLQLLNVLDLEERLDRNKYTINLEMVRTGLTLYIPKHKDQPQLEKFLIGSFQLEKFLIDREETAKELINCFSELEKVLIDGSQLEKVLIDKKYFLSQLEKVLIQNRKISNCQRGRKPNPEARSRGNFQNTEIREITREITLEKDTSDGFANANHHDPLSQFSDLGIEQDILLTVFKDWVNHKPEPQEEVISNIGSAQTSKAQLQVMGITFHPLTEEPFRYEHLFTISDNVAQDVDNLPHAVNPVTPLSNVATQGAANGHITHNGTDPLHSGVPLHHHSHPMGMETSQVDPPLSEATQPHATQATQPLADESSVIVPTPSENGVQCVVEASENATDPGTMQPPTQQASTNYPIADEATTHDLVLDMPPISSTRGVAQVNDRGVAQPEFDTPSAVPSEQAEVTQASLIPDTVKPSNGTMGVNGGKQSTKGSKGKKANEDVAPTPKSIPQMPPADMQWGTRKCMMKFDAWRGAPILVQYKLQQASHCAKGLAEHYTEEEVESAYVEMNNDPYYAERGGADICDVANNIAKVLKKIARKKNTSSRSQIAAAKVATKVFSSFDDPNFTDEDFKNEFYPSEEEKRKRAAAKQQRGAG